MNPYYYQNFNVLSNEEIINIIIIAICSYIFLWPLFEHLASRNAVATDNKKGLFRKSIPWILLFILISNICLLISECTGYPWDITPEPSQASEYRELQYLGSTNPIWGWANDYQLKLLNALSFTILSFCWTVYAFNFKPSATSWWKKTCKVVAYIIISCTILGFSFHELRDITTYLIIFIITTLLLWIARVKAPQTVSEEAAEETIKPKQSESEKNKWDAEQNENQPSVNSSAADIEYYKKYAPNIDSSIPKQVENATETTPNPIESLNENPELLIEDYHKVPPTQALKVSKTKIEIMYCKYCGKRIEADSIFCKYCGKQL